MKRFAPLAIGLALSSCTSPRRTPETGIKIDPAKIMLSQGAALTRDAATLRAKEIQNISYSLWLGLDPQDDEFQGRITVRFDLKTRAKELMENTGQPLPSIWLMRPLAPFASTAWRSTLR